MALQTKRYAVWADTGLGKTAILLEFARQIKHRTRGKVLLISPLNIIKQTMDEAVRFYPCGELEIERLETRLDMREWCRQPGSGIAIVNPQKFIPRDGEPEIVSELQHLCGVVLDEASLLKSGGGKIKWSLIKSCRGIEYKMTCTATPAPNDTMEYASQGSFLEKLRSEGEIIWTYFCRDKFGNWKVKDHARHAFYRFMSGWSIYLRNPKNYGFADNLKGLPEPVFKTYVLQPTPDQAEIARSIPDAAGQLALFGKGDDEKLAMQERIRFSQIAKGFLYRPGQKPERHESAKPGFVAELVHKEAAAGLQVMVWTVFDEESAIISELIPHIDRIVLTGKIPQAKRPALIERFRSGEAPVLISKASLLGFGLNFQNCGSMIFSGFNDSFEQYYQAVRRAYRYGQTKSVRVHIPYIPELEGVVWDNICKKQDQFVYDTTIQERNYREAMRKELACHLV